MSKFVIIGNGVAAAGCIEGIRSVDKDSEVTVISAEKHPVYSRPLISYYLEGKTDTERMLYRSKDFYEKNKAELVYASAEKIDAKKGEVIYGSKKARFDKLCIAAGSSPFVPPMQGLDKVKTKFTFMTIDDSLALEKVLRKDSRVLIIGAGLIGLKCAEGILERVSSVTVCDLADRVLSSILDNDCAAVVQKHLESKGIRFLLSDSAESFESSSAKMKSGETVDFDILVLAVGVRANTQLAKDAGADVNRGILIDTSMKTSLENIYAAGDCTEGFDSSIGSNRVLAILPNAYMQGFCAGVNMAGGEQSITNAIPMNSIGFFGLHCVSAGSYFTKDEGEIYEEKTCGGIKRLYIKDDKLAGYIIIGDVTGAGIYTSLVREKTPLCEVDIDKLKKDATLAMFLPETRRKKLGGVV